MTKLPALQFYVGDWRKDPGVQALDYEAKGVWLEILLLMHESEDRGRLILNDQPMTDDALARNLGLPEAEAKQIVSKIEAYGVASRDPATGALYCRRMVRDEEIRQAKVAAGRKGGQVSRPPAAKQNGSRTEAEGEANGGSSVSVAVSVSKNNPPNPPFETEFLEFWEMYPLKVGRKKALKAFQARRRAKVAAAQILDALNRYLKWAEATDTRLMHPSTFVGPAENWKEPWTITEANRVRKKGNGKTERPETIDPKFTKVFTPVIEPRQEPSTGGAK